MPNAVAACPLRGRVDPRLLRFSAGATAFVLAAALLVVDAVRPLGLFLLATQVAVFAFTAFVSFQWSVWAQVFARVVWPRLEAPARLEDARPPRFAQLVGFVLTAVSLVAFIIGTNVVGYAFASLALAAAALNAAAGLCVGCKLYGLVRGGQPAGA
ncbi:DUF4395 domain-containing protein [Nocardioides bigeumensis]|uniref:DUF4395 domain-containing protein n=1 Tax=Nocardioides bigeumensis TaxID=433657 RepID=A0ABN2YPB4_9ACTN